MPNAFLLLNTMPGEEVQVRESVAQLDCVKGVWVVFGNFDCFVKLEADDEEKLTEAIVKGIRNVQE